MRSPHFLTIAVRKPDNTILIRELHWKGISDRFPICKKPFLRGIVTLIESMTNGIEALSYSANVAIANDPDAKKESTGSSKTSDGSPNSPKSTNEEPQALSNLAIMGSIAFAFAMGMGLFVAAPHLVTLWLGKQGLFQSEVAHPAFHLIDGFFKVLFLVSYIFLIALMKDIKRVFQYHGAEHKSIYTFEQGEELTVENAKRHTTLHPRCGTSFLLFLLIISILVFSAFFPALGVTKLSDNVILHHLILIIMKIFLMLPIAGISYEFIRLSSRHTDNLIFRILIFPGLLLQKLTTREPTDDQLEIALASLKRVLYLEKNPQSLSVKELEITSLAQINPVAASVGEFLG